MLNPKQVTACLVTRGDQPEMMERILDSLIFPNVIVWDNSKDFDHKTLGRYCATGRTTKPVVYFQDDDVLVPRETQEALVEAYEPGVMTAVYGHGENDGGYGDLPLVCGGGLVDREVPALALLRYREHHPLDDSFKYYCDFAAGILYPSFKQLHLPFHIQMEIAQHPSRLCNQLWAADMKADVTAKARAIRDAG